MVRVDTHRSRVLLGAAATLALAAVLGTPAVSYAAASDNGGDSAPCFLLRAWDGQWRVSPDSRSIYVKENGVVYRFDLQQPITLLQSAWAVLNTRDTSEAVCQPTDLHLIVSDRLGAKEFAQVSKITRLTPEEVAALPKKLRP